MASIQENIIDGLDKNASLVGNKFSKNNWTSIERKLSDFDLKIKDELCHLACTYFNIYNTEKTQENIIKAIGDDYLTIRQDLIDLSLIKNIPSNHIHNSDDVKKSKQTKKSTVKKADLLKIFLRLRNNKLISHIRQMEGNKIKI